MNSIEQLERELEKQQKIHLYLVLSWLVLMGFTCGLALGKILWDA